MLHYNILTIWKSIIIFHKNKNFEKIKYEQEYKYIEIVVKTISGRILL